MTLRGIAHRRAIRGPLLPTHDDVFRFIGEDKRGGGVSNNAQFDAGSARVPITISDYINCRRYRDRSVARQGLFQALWVGTNTVYAEFPYLAASAVRGGSGNAITSGDFYVGGDLYYTGAVASDTYPVSIQDATPTAAGTAWAFHIDSAGVLSFAYSDGTTRRVLTAKTATFTASGWYRVSAERVGTRIYLACSTANSRTVTVRGEVTFTASMNVPSGAVIRFSKALASPNGIANSYWDTWQIKRHSLFGGGHYYAHVDPVPFSVGIKGPEVDPYFSLVKLLFDFASSTGHGLVDLSSSPAIFTNNGGVAITTGVGDPFGDGLGAAGFAASTWISTDRVPGSAAGDFCNEAYIYRTATSGVIGRIITGQDAGQPLTTFYIDGSNFLVGTLRDAGGSLLACQGVTAVPLNTWQHVAFVRKATNMGVWLHGVLDATVGSAGLDITGAPAYEIGSLGIAASTQFFPGSIRAGRVTEGHYRYDATFVPPAAFYQLA